jgi:hypothetical protein
MIFLLLQICCLKKAVSHVPAAKPISTILTPIARDFALWFSSASVIRRLSILQHYSALVQEIF